MHHFVVSYHSVSPIITASPSRADLTKLISDFINYNCNYLG